MVARRDTGEKQSLPLSALETEIKLILEQMQKSLYEKARANLDKNIQMVEDIKDAEKALSAGKLIFAPWCATEKCEESFKEKTGAKSLNSPFQQPVLKKSRNASPARTKPSLGSIWEKAIERVGLFVKKKDSISLLKIQIAGNFFIPVNFHFSGIAMKIYGSSDFGVPQIRSYYGNF